jgi:hypothetical protein
MWFLHVKWQTRQIPDTCPTGMNFYPRVWVRVWIFTRDLFADGRVITLPIQTWLVAIPTKNISLICLSVSPTTIPISTKYYFFFHPTNPACFLSLPPLILNWMGSGERKLIFKYYLSQPLKLISYLGYPLKRYICQYTAYRVPILDLSVHLDSPLELALTCL